MKNFNFLIISVVMQFTHLMFPASAITRFSNLDNRFSRECVNNAALEINIHYSITWFQSVIECICLQNINLLHSTFL